jgi:type II secretory pathway component PulK
MKIRATRKNESGLAVIIALLLISLMLVFVTANTNALYQLRREIKLTDQRQQQRWVQVMGTNRVETPGKEKK